MAIFKRLVLLASLSLVLANTLHPTEQVLESIYGEQGHAPASNSTKLWAVLVAGSNEWYNYRHQADICHSYQILHSHGIPDEQIIVMMFDDLAENSQNPNPGVVINHPKGKDVYKGVPKDYIGKDVTPQNFLKVLKGDSKGLAGVGSGKVLGSGPNDHVFIYFADHGAPGLIAFPTDELSATDMNKAITEMHESQRYAKMVLYIEACESGSMFENLLPKNINVYATTAANPDESSYACYYDDSLETYLGDVYSVVWMEDSDKEVLTAETLKKQFQLVKKGTNTSHVMQYGDLSISSMHVSEFQGKKPQSFNGFVPPFVPLDPVPSEDVPLAIMYRKLAKTNVPEVFQKLQKDIKKLLRDRSFLSSKVTEIVKLASEGHNMETILYRRHPLRDHQCYQEVRQYFDQECFQLSKNAFALRKLYTLVNLCEESVPIEAIKSAMDKVCLHPSVHGIL